MKNKSVLILSALVLALGIYAYFGEYKREIHETQQKETNSKIITLKKDQIQKIEIKKGDRAPIVLERTVDGWDVLKPVNDQADNEVIESFLDQITGEKAVDQITPQADNPAEYGFKPSLGTVTLIDNTGHRQEIEVSSKKNFEGLVFLRRDKEKKILTSSQTWTTFLTKPVDQFRDLRLFRGSISKVNMIRVTGSHGSFEFRYDDGFWFSPQKTEWKIDQNAVREILTQATAAKGTSVIAATKYGPVGPHLLTLEFGTGKTSWKGLLHQDTKTKDVIGAIAPDRMIIRFPPQILEELRHKKLIDFRDKTEPFHFSKDQVSRIVARTRLKSYTLMKKDDHWVLDKIDPMVEVNSTLAQDLVGKLNRMTVYRFIEGTQPKVDLDSQVQLYDGNNKLVFQLSWSDFKDHEGYAQTNLFKEIFQIDDAQIHRLMLQEIVKVKPSKTATQDEESKVESKSETKDQESEKN